MCKSCEDVPSPGNFANLQELSEDVNRPIFILEIKNDQSQAELRPTIIFTNSSFRGVFTSCDERDNFEEWISDQYTQGVISDLSCPASLEYAGRSWTWIAFRNIFIFQSFITRKFDIQDDERNRRPPNSESKSKSGGELGQHQTYTEASGSRNSISDRRRGPSRAHFPSFALKNDGSSCALVNVDWTSSKSEPGTLPPFVRFFRNFDWSSTPLGPMSSWSVQLRQTVIMALANPDPRLILWGDEMTLIYNEACVAVIGQKHPQALGSPPTELFAEAWEAMSRPVRLALHKGVTTKIENFHLAMYRADSLEETYWSFTILPIVSSGGFVVGAINEFTEVTDLVISERRLTTILSLGEKGMVAKGIKDLWSKILDALRPNPHDIPFAVVYSVTDTNSKENVPSNYLAMPSEPRSCLLEGYIGIEKTDGFRKQFSLVEGQGPFESSFYHAWKEGVIKLVNIDDRSLPENIAYLTGGGRGFGESIREAVVIPIPPLSGSNIMGFILIGLNPRRPFDSDYHTFMRLISDRLIKAVATICLPAEQRKTQALADETELRHATVSKELLKRAQAAERTERSLASLTAQAPVGCALFHPDGRPIWMNMAYNELSGISKSREITGSWSDAIHDEDKEKFQSEWNKLTSGSSIEPFEFRAKYRISVDATKDGDSATEHRWLLLNASSEVDDEGNCHMIYGWLTDISHQKYAELLQAQRLEDALETKRQSEIFIDMTSHEMRNPLSAILQSADGILEAIRPESVDLLTESLVGAAVDQANSVMGTITECAKTIVFCAQHQKRIVDDILTLSKLDADLLVLSPEVACPVKLVEQVLRMYSAEMETKEIIPEKRVDESFRTLSVGGVILDTSRLLQVLINLLTNAVKFTQSQPPPRRITISLSASLKKPHLDQSGLYFESKRFNRPENPPNADWGNGEAVYLLFSVEDTGCGIKEEELRLLFHRFSQASPKTYSKYGGSGLGLFISKELTELQGGQMGVKSTYGEGSTFYFFIESRRRQQRGTPPTAPGNPRRTSSARPEERTLAPASLKRAEHSPTFYDIQNPARTVSPTPSSLASSGTSDESLRALGLTLHILLVEDNQINARVVAAQLRNWGCTVHCATDGLEALRFLERTDRWRGASSSPNSSSAASESTSSGSSASPSLHSPKPTGKTTTEASAAGAHPPRLPLSVILLDVEMPVMDGLTCISRVRELERAGALAGHVPTIAVTANARREKIARALERGMDLVVTKPFRVRGLMAEMGRLVERIGRGDEEGERKVDGERGRGRDARRAGEREWERGGETDGVDGVEVGGRNKK